MHVHQEICIVILSSEASQEQNETKSAKEVLVDPSTTANLPSLHIQKNPKNICTGHTSPPGSPPKKTPENQGSEEALLYRICFETNDFGTTFLGPLLKSMEAAAPSLFCALAALGLRWQHGQFTTAGGNASWEPRRSFINMRVIWGPYTWPYYKWVSLGVIPPKI